MESNSTAPLRKAAPEWSLAGDKQLLDILQNIHQSLMTRCQEVNLRLDEMVAVLDDASVDLQNVNNKFMALSNSQFIESRVYDDDEDVATQAPAKESPKHQTPDPSTCIKASVRILHGAHETIRILASDTDTDTDDEDGARVVLKPKDAYSHRPLPHIIGSHAWKAKWHAGLHAEESDSDSVVSKPDGEEYSDSEPEASRDGGHPSRMDDEQESITGSEAMSEQELSLPPPKPSPADVAAALARRLRGGTPQMPDEDFAYSPPQPASRKVYRPEKPAPGVIFSDDPPPFDGNQSEEEQYSPEDDDDIFAELHKNKPYTSSNKVQNAAEDLSSLKYRKDYQGNLFDDLKDDKVTPLPANQKTTLYEDESEPELFVTKPTVRDTVERGSAPPHAEAVKKPIGGISLFGSNKGAESIGAAILKRNQRKSSSEEEKLTAASPKPIPKEKPLKTTEKDIFDNLFAKSVKEKKVTKDIKETNVVSNKESKTDKVDLFSDNIFDDIDDIFTTNVVTTKTSGGNQKSLFDDNDDVDDLFSDIAVPKSKVEVKSEDKKTSIFDSDDDLFSDNVVKPETTPKGTSESISKASVSKNIETSKENKILYEDESSDNDIFSKINESKIVSARISNVEKEINKEQLSNSNELRTEEIKYNTDSLQDNLFTNNVINNNVAKQANDVKSKAQNTIFAEDNDDSDDLFNETNKNTKYNSKKNDVTKIHPNTVGSQNGTNKISLFDDEDDNTDLFSSSSNKALTNKVVDAINNESATSSSKMKSNNLFNKDFGNASKETENNNIFVNSVDTSKSDNSSKSEKNYETDVSKQKPSFFNDNSDDNLFSRNDDKLFKQNHPVSAVIPDKSGGDIDNKVVSQRKSQTSINIQIEKEVITEITEGLSQSSLNSSDIKPSKNVNTIEQINVNSKHDRIKPEIPEPDFPNSPISEIEEEDSLFSIPKDAISNITDDIFSKITDEPPAFEKPKESKKSKNVNALFDDDSDDEALFFKKNDVVFDELPDVSADSNDPLFGIFHDEPPAIDVGFSPKTSVSNDDNLFKTEPLKSSKETTSYNFNYDFLTDNDSTEKLKTENDKLSTKVSDSDINQRFNKLNATDDFLKTDSEDALFKTVKPVENTSSKPVIATKPIRKDTDHTHTDLLKDNLEQHTKTDLNAETVTSKIVQPSSPKRESISSDTPDSPETNKIGKLKTMNFNIDVSTLLPGASPKKKVIEQTDGLSLSTNNQEDQIKSISEDTMVKAVSFEGDPDSQILDNKISKERAKIQVKRRPSTRRARKDAVRQSVLDLGEDSTDNSNSTDDAPRVKVRKEPIESANDSDLEQSVDNRVETPISNVVSKTNKTHERIESETANDIFGSKDITTEKEITPPENVYNPDVKNNTNPELSTSEIVSRRVDSKTVTSKIVYILNDEDIFNTDDKKTKTPTNILNLEDDDDDLFKNLNSKTEVKSSVSTLGSVYKNTSKPEDTKTTDNDNKTASNVVSTSKKSVLDLSDDENELFNTKKVLSKHKGILDSDSDEDLFGGKRDTNRVLKVGEVKEVKRQMVVKKSLFGDDDDDDELFGAKAKVQHGEFAAPSQPTKSQKEVSKPSEPEVVFDDPLSMLGGDDD